MFKITFSKLFENMLNITIEVNARPENGRISLIVQWYKMVHFMMRIIALIINAFLNYLRHLVNTVHISSVALSPWIMNVFGLHINETSTIGPQIVISTFC